MSRFENSNKKSLLALSLTLILWGCSGDGSSGGTSGGSGNIISCDVKSDIAGASTETCTEIQESSPAASVFKQTCESQNIAGVSTATIGSGCPATQGKCTIGEQTTYYYGEAAKYVQCAETTSPESTTPVANNVFSCQVKNTNTNICSEISQNSASATTFQAGCNMQKGSFGTGCPVSTKKCQSGEEVLYFYDTSDLLKSCDELLNEGIKNSDQPTISGDKVSFLYMATYGNATDTIYCYEFSASDPSLTSSISAETNICNSSAQESDELAQFSCIIGIGCPSTTKKVCSVSKNALTYFYDGDESTPCPNEDY